jgi:flagellar biogenesis protein FliO
VAGGLQAAYVANSPQAETVQPDGLAELGNNNAGDSATNKLGAAESSGLEESVPAPASADQTLPVGRSQNTQAEVASDAFETRTLTREFESKTSRSEKASAKTERKSAGSLSPWRMLMALVVVLVLLVSGAFFLRRYMRVSGRTGNPNGMEILSKNSINARQSVCMMKVGSRVLVLGVSPNHMAALDVIDDPDEVATITGDIETSLPRSISHSFGKFFKKESQQFEQERSDRLEGAESESQSYRDPGQIQQAKRELAGLLDKVKGLSRIRRP